MAAALRIAALLLVAVALSPTGGVAQAQLPCGGLLLPACPPPAPPPAPPPPPAEPVPVAATLSLSPAKVTRRTTELPTPARFRGTVTGVADPKGLFVDLEVKVPSYGSRARLPYENARVAADGTFAFQLEPKVGVEVRAVLRAGQRATGQSPVRLLVIRSRRTLSLQTLRSRRGRFVMTSSVPHLVPLVPGSVVARAGSGRVGYLYAVAPGGRTAHRIATGRVQPRFCAALCSRSAIGRFRITARVRRAQDFIACSRAPFFLGVEEPGVFPECGRSAKVDLR